MCACVCWGRGGRAEGGRCLEPGKRFQKSVVGAAHAAHPRDPPASPSLPPPTSKPASGMPAVGGAKGMRPATLTPWPHSPPSLAPPPTHQRGRHGDSVGGGAVGGAAHKHGAHGLVENTSTWV
jgi:hypothetical protein